MSKPKDLESVNEELQKETAERQRAEQLLEASALKSRLILEKCYDAFITIDTQGIITDWNPKAEELFGWTSSEAIGQTLTDTIIPQRYRQAHKDGLAKYLATAQGPVLNQRLELSALNRNNIEFPVELIIFPVTLGTQTIFCAFLHDISARKQSEGELEKARAELTRSNQELEQFAYVAAHDLQEPLRKVRAFGDRLKMAASTKLDEKELDYLDRMHNASKRMQDLIDGLLTLSRITSRGNPFSPVDLGQIVAEVLLDLETSIERSSAELKLGDLPIVEADPIQMRQLLQNLISNSLKFQPASAKPIVKITAQKIERETAELVPSAGKTMCRISVEDNGIGFEERYLGRIFGVFQRLHGRDEYEGTGIGLAVCRKIVERHGGNITATSTPGRGSTFMFTLPLHISKEKEAGESNS